MDAVSPAVTRVSRDKVAWCSRVIAIASGSMAMLVVIGWVADIDIVKAVNPGWATMKVNTALGFLLAAGALFLISPVKGCSGHGQVMASRLLGGGVVAIGVVNVLEYTFAWDLGIDQLFIVDESLSTAPAAVPGRMAFNTAMAFSFIGAALAFAPARGARWRSAAELLALGAALIGFLAVLGYALNVRALQAFAPYSTMAFHTALAFVLLGVAVMLRVPGGRAVALLRSRSTGGQLLRSLLPAAILVPPLLSWLRLIGEDAGLFPHEVGVAAYATLTVVIFLALLSLVALRLDRADTRRLTAEAANHRGQELNRAIVDTAVDAIITIDEYGIIESANIAAGRMFGYSIEELAGKNVSMLMPAQHARAHDGYIKRYLETGVARIIGIGREVTGQRKDGTIFPADLAISEVHLGEPPRMFAGILRDLTERKRAERVASHYAAIVDSSADAIISMSVDGMLASWNPAAERLFGYRAAEVIGKPVTMLIPAERHNEEPVILAKVQQGQRIEAFDTLRQHRNGSAIHVSLSVSPILDSSGAVVGASKILRDVTDRVRAEQALRDNEQSLRQHAEALARSNADLEQFAYIASHDLQEPLRGVAGALQLLERRYRGKLDERADEFITHAVLGSHRMQALINDLLSYSRLERRGTPFAAVNCNDVMSDVLHSLRTVIDDSSASVQWSDLPMVNGDAAQLERLFQNLISNAVKFRSPERTPRITVSARLLDAREQEGDSPMCEFMVEDNGIGIEPQHFERIFLVFQRLHTRREYEGTGIGLAICRRIVERHGGRIWLESIPETGTRFFVTLPLAQPILHAETHLNEQPRTTH